MTSDAQERCNKSIMGEGCVCRRIYDGQYTCVSVDSAVVFAVEDSDGCSSDNLVHVSAIEESRSLRAKV